MKIDLVPTNDRHHVATLVPLAQALRQRGHHCRMVSIAEWRGLETPIEMFRDKGLDAVRVVPPIRRVAARPLRFAQKFLHGGNAQSEAQPSVAKASGEPSRSRAKAIASDCLVARMRWLARANQTDCIVVMNDAAPPSRDLVRALQRDGVPYALVQEGIRFPLPSETAASGVYGGQGAKVICAWGNASAEHFRVVAPTATRVVATGTPRFSSWTPPKQQRTPSLGEPFKIGVFTNPIDAQGFVTRADKFKAFKRLVKAAVHVDAERSIRIVVRHHGGESGAAYQSAIDEVEAAHLCSISTSPLQALMSDVHAGIIFASSVGLEVLMAGLPLGVLETRGHGFVHDFVAAKAAVPLPFSALEEGLLRLMQQKGDTARSSREAYVKQHLEFGDPSSAMADAVEAVVLNRRMGR